MVIERMMSEYKKMIIKDIWVYKTSGEEVDNSFTGKDNMTILPNKSQTAHSERKHKETLKIRC